MATTNLFGPHRLTKAGIDAAVKGVGPGAYALGKSADGEKLTTIKYVGRSDSDLNQRLHQHEDKYTHFKYAFYPDSKAAYEKECHLFHDFNPPDNTNHPAVPKNTSYTCPRKCGN